MKKVIQITLSKLDSQNEILERVVCCCNFCNKKVEVKSKDYKMYFDLGHSRFYCPFCLRNRFTYKLKKNILLLDFHGIIGYYINYLYPEREIWWSQILEMITQHICAGYSNPAFVYDSESLTWFVDFTKVGKSCHKISVDRIHETIESIIEKFQLTSVIQRSDEALLKKKYRDAVTVYYEQRERPYDRRILSPTLKDCILGNIAWTAENWDASKNFYLSEVDSVSADPLFNAELYKPYTKLYDEDLLIEVEQKLVVTVKSRKSKGVEFWEGEVHLPYMAPTKISNKAGETRFDKRTSLNTAARTLAKKLGLNLEYA